MDRPVPRPRVARESPDPLASLARQAAGGHSASLEQLLLRLLPRTRNLVRYLIRGDRDVDDVAQAALFVVARRLGTFEGRGAFASWVDRIVARTTFAEIRRRAHAERLAASPPLEGLPSPEDAASPDEYLARRRIARLLDQLPDDQRIALVLHHVVEMTVPEIAEETGAPAETIRSRLRLGRQRLRALEMGAFEDEGHARA